MHALFGRDGLGLRPSLPQETILSRKLSTSKVSESWVQTEPMKIGIGNCKELLGRINVATVECNNALDVKRLKKEYKAEVRHLILPCCLITPGALHHKATEFLCFQTYLITKRDPKFISSYELMVRKKAMPNGDDWTSFIRNLIKKRVFVVEDWTKKNIGNIETLFYDPGSMEEYRGESDASFRAGKATLSIVIWKGNKIVWSEVFKDVPCSSIIVAEAYAALALLFKCIDLKIKNLVMWTDNEAVRDAVTGVLTVRTSSSDHDLLMLLGYTRKYFTKLVCMWKHREVMFLSDNLSKDPTILYAEQALAKWSYELSGKPLYKITQTPEANSVINKFVCREYEELGEKKYFMTADPANKIESIIKIRETLTPSELYVCIDQFEGKPLEFKKQIGKLFPDGYLLQRNKQCTIMSSAPVMPNGQEGGKGLIDPVSQEGGKHLLVVFDFSIPPDCYEHLGIFTVVLVAPLERASVKGIKELNALSYVHFRGVKDLSTEPQQLKWKEWKKAMAGSSSSK